MRQRRGGRLRPPLFNYRKAVMDMTKRLFLFALAFFILSALRYPLSTDAANGEDGPVTVRIINVAFEPGVITIEAGTTVRWVNMDPVVHDVTSGTTITGRKARKAVKTRFPDGRFRSGVFPKDGVFEVTFKEPGVYPYYCSVHPVMTGKVVVK